MKSRRAVKPPLILGIVAERGGGKSTVANYLRREYGAGFVRFSDTLSRMLRMLDIDPNSTKQMGALAMALRQTFGADVLSRAVIARVRLTRGRLAVIDGFRKPGDLIKFRPLKNFRLLYVTAPVAVRHARAARRKSKTEDGISLAEFVKLEKTYPAELDIPKVGRMANFRIDNVGTRVELEAKVDALARKLKVRK